MEYTDIMIPYNGVVYSAKEASEKFNVSIEDINDRINRGLKSDEVLGLSKRGKKYSVNGEYLTIKMMSIKYGVSEGTIRYRINKGKIGASLIKKAVKIKNKLSINIDGEDVLLTEVSKRYGIGYNTIKSRVNSGWTVDEVIGRVERAGIKRKELELNGEKVSVREISEKYNIKKSTIYNKLNSGMTIGDIVRKDIVAPEPMKIELCGIDITVRDASKMYGLTTSKIYSRLSIGWSPEEAVGIKRRDKRRTKELV